MHPFYRQANRGSVVFDELAKPLVHVCRQSSHGRGKTPRWYLGQWVLAQDLFGQVCPRWASVWSSEIKRAG